MTVESPITMATPSMDGDRAGVLVAWLRHWPLLAGALVLLVPTIAAVMTQSWSTEQGAHGPIVAATGFWLIGREWRAAARVARPGGAIRTGLLLAPALALYVVARVTGILEIEGPAMYLALLAALYGTIGGAALRVLWFPLVYLLFLFPPPDQLMAAITQPLKIGLSHGAVALLAAMGMPIARTGVMIQVAQYDVLVAAACAGLNSIISLSAIGLFYVYVRHHAHWRYAVLLMVAIVPLAILSNFLRVLMLILITYFGGDEAAQGFMHEFAGLFMFMVALGGIIALDASASPLRARLDRGGDAQ